MSFRAQRGTCFFFYSDSCLPSPASCFSPPPRLSNRPRLAYTFPMLRKLVSAIYRGLFWTYERGTWQYDIMVALILLFIFLTPRGWFHDQPHPPEASGVVLL